MVQSSSLEGSLMKLAIFSITSVSSVIASDKTPGCCLFIKILCISKLGFLTSSVKNTIKRNTLNKN